MDRKELASKIEKYRKACEVKGYPLNNIWAEEAFPGVVGTSYIIKVAADWAHKKGYSKSLDILIDILWETFNEKGRRFVFAIFLNPKEEAPHDSPGGQEKTQPLQAA